MPKAHHQTLSPLDALDWLQANGSLSEDQVQAWANDRRDGWEERWNASPFQQRCQ